MSATETQVGGPYYCDTSLRDQFALTAFKAYLEGRNQSNECTRPEYVAETCYKYADAMLAAREKGTK